MPGPHPACRTAFFDRGLGTVLTWAAAVLIWSAIPALTWPGTASAFGSPVLAGAEIEDLLETVVSPARHPQQIIESPRSVSVITAEQIRQGNYRTVPEALSELSGVFVQETNYGGGAPIVRGLIGNRVLILVDGIRLNNSTYRLGPNQYLNTIDIGQVDRIEVIRGTRSVLYGSDAIGGVINVITQSPEPPSTGKDASVRFRSRMSTADRGAINRVSADFYRRGIGLLAGLTGKSFDDLRSGTGRQPFTGYRETNGDLKLTVSQSLTRGLTASFQRVRQGDVPRTDVLNPGLKGEPPTELVSLWQPERRDLFSAEYHDNAVGYLVESFQATASYQTQLEDQTRILAATPTVERHESNEVRTAGLDLQAGSDLGEHHSFTYGTEYNQDRVTSRRADLDLNTLRKSTKGGRVADGARYRSGAVYVQDEIRAHLPVTLTLGMLYSRFSLNAVTDDPKTGRLPLLLRTGAFTGSAYGSWRIPGNVYLIAGVGQGFRAPNVDDVTVQGSFAAGYEVPNQALAPEHAVTYEIGVKHHGSRFSGTLFGFAGHYRNLIDRIPGTFNGLSFLDTDHDGVRQPSEESVFIRTNRGHATIRGVEVEAGRRFGRTADLHGNVAWYRGEDMLTHQPLSKIPPLNGMLRLRWSPRACRWGEAYTIFACRQSRLSDTDRSDRRIATNGTPGWVTLNVRGGFVLSRTISASLALENLADKTYRLHGSGIDAPGRNLVFGLQVLF